MKRTKKEAKIVDPERARELIDKFEVDVRCAAIELHCGEGLDAEKYFRFVREYKKTLMRLLFPESTITTTQEQPE